MEKLSPGFTTSAERIREVGLTENDFVFWIESGRAVPASLNAFYLNLPAMMIQLNYMDGLLYFAAVQDLEDQVYAMIDVGVKVIVLRLRRMHLLASSGISTLEVLIKRARENGHRIKLAGVSEEVMQILRSCKLENEIESKNIFMATEIPYESTRKAITTDLELNESFETK